MLASYPASETVVETRRCVFQNFRSNESLVARLVPNMNALARCVKLSAQAPVIFSALYQSALISTGLPCEE